MSCEKTRKFIFILICLFASVTYADKFLVNKIVVEGAERISIGTIYNDLPVKQGEIFDTDESSKVIDELYSTGFFTDIELSRKDDTLVVKVVERPSVGEIKISGNSDLSTEDLIKALRQIGIEKGHTFDQALLNRVELELQQQYFSRGKYGVVIESSVKKLERNRVSLAVDIKEGKAAKIKQINIVGNKQFSEKELLSQFKLTTPGILTWLTSNDQYSKEKLNSDLEILRSFYLDRGYIKFTIKSTQVSISPNKQNIYITINIDEGSRYKLGEYSFSGDLILPKEELFSSIDIKKNDWFSRKEIAKAMSIITEKFGDEGYAFAQLNPTQNINEENKTIEIDFIVDPGKKYYVRYIRIQGNHYTDSSVIRRELKQFESAYISTAAIKDSKRKLMLLGIFERVEIEPETVPGTADELDLLITVIEQKNGEFSGGLGYSGQDGLLFNLQLKQNNFLGSGKFVDFNFNRADAYSSYRIGYNNPYYTIEGISRGFDLYYQDTNPGKSNITDYSFDAFGGSLYYGVPISNNNRLALGANLEHSDLDISNTAGTMVKDFKTKNGSNFNNLKLNLSFTHNGLDRSLMPTKGISHSVTLQALVPGSDLLFAKLTSYTSWYKPLYKDDYILLLKGRLGIGESYGKTSRLPFFENYYAGGIGSVRGYKGNTLGPLDQISEDKVGKAIGANFMAVGSSELIVPTPFATTNSLRSSLFVDLGNVISTYAGADNRDMGLSVGATIQWASPVGPFVVSFAKALIKDNNTETQSFQFTVGGMF